MNSPAMKLALAVGIALLTFAPSQANAAATGSISGTIQGDPTGYICARDVWVFDSAGNRVAGINGQMTGWDWDDYKIGGLEPGEYRLSFDQYCIDRPGPTPPGVPARTSASISMTARTSRVRPPSRWLKGLKRPASTCSSVWATPSNGKPPTTLRMPNRNQPGPKPGSAW